MIVPVEDMIAAIKRGEMIILVDDEARENEGDLLLAAILSRRRPSILWPHTLAGWFV